MPALFPLAQYWWLYAAFTAVVVILLALDLGFHREARPVRIREAAGWTVVWVSLALAFNVALYVYARWTFAGDERLAEVPGFDPEAAAWQTATVASARWSSWKSIMRV